MNRDSQQQNLNKKRKDSSQPPIEDAQPPKKKKQGRRKIKIEFIEDKSRRQITFSKRKAGIMKKAYELTTLTGTQALLLIASETGHVYTFATPKLQPFVTRQDGKALIQRCLNSPDPGPLPDEQNYGNQSASSSSTNIPVGGSSNTAAADDGVPQIPPFVESSLVIMVGKTIPVVQGFTASNFKDLSAIAMRWSQQLSLPICCLAGGYPSVTHEFFRSPNDRVNAEVVLGIKVAEVDYTSPNQPYFSLEKLHAALENSSKQLIDDIWREVSTKHYVVDSSNAEKSWKPLDYNSYKPDLLQIPDSLYVVSTYPNAFVNVVFGVRKQGANGKGNQVVGISCHQPESHVCKLDIDERSHQQRVQLMGGVEGVPYYHLLPELFK
jgi:hypothetical protein